MANSERDLLFITGNPGKFAEVQAILLNVSQIDIDLVEIQEVDPRRVVRHKLEEALKCQGGEFVVEDTSLSLECLDGLPGPLIKWFLQTVGNDGLFRIADKLGNYDAKARTIVGLVTGDGDIHFFEGVIKGKIVSPRGEGFGWDPIFQPEGYDKTYGEMTADEKNEISMRKIALNKLKDFLELRN